MAWELVMSAEALRYGIVVGLLLVQPTTESRMPNDLGVTRRGLHADPEQIAQPADVASGREGLVEDAVFTQNLGSEAEFDTE
ncbi:hypothetical protein, partial [Frankia sp. AvcI1]|uniref:hypothetical protein n=1 Tax=Frankia sp. AvcI1 TaxID=573496 RepID=UPI001F3F38D7